MFCMPNVKQIIDGHNKATLKKATQMNHSTITPQKCATVERKMNAH